MLPPADGSVPAPPRHPHRPPPPASATPTPAAPRSTSTRSRPAEFVSPDTKDGFATVSYEKIGDYAGDVILVDARNTYTKYQRSAVWKSMPAVKAGRVFAWKPAAPYSYAASVPILQGFGEAYAAVG